MQKFQKFCDVLDQRFESISYQETMDSVFCLVPNGRQTASYRLAEALKAGCIPVILGLESTLMPFQGLIPWRDIAIYFPMSQLNDLVPTLRKIRQDRILEMRSVAKKYGQIYLQNWEAILRTSIDITTGTSADLMVIFC